MRKRSKPTLPEIFNQPPPRELIYPVLHVIVLYGGIVTDLARIYIGVASHLRLHNRVHTETSPSVPGQVVFHNNVRHAAGILVKRGLITRHHRGEWKVTEDGFIACRADQNVVDPRPELNFNVIPPDPFNSAHQAKTSPKSRKKTVFHA